MTIDLAIGFNLPVDYIRYDMPILEFTCETFGLKAWGFLVSIQIIHK